MPLIGYTCPQGSPTAGQRNDGIEHCISRCPHPCITPPLLEAMWNSEHSNHHKGAYLSASSLASDSCARQTWLERYSDFYETPRRRYWPFRGTIIHALVEGGGTLVKKYGWLQEVRMAVPLRYPEYPAPVFDEHGVWTGDWDSTRPLEIVLGGTMDIGNPWTRELHDMKTLSDEKLPKFFDGKLGGRYSAFIKDPWVLQTNIYAWMWSKTRVSPEDRLAYRALGLPELPEHSPYPERLRMQLISMMEIPLTGTTYAALPKIYPAPVDVQDVPLLPPEDVEAYIRERALFWFKWLGLRVKPPVVEKRKQFMCDNCQFNGERLFGERCHPKQERADEAARLAALAEQAALDPDIQDAA